MNCSRLTYQVQGFQADDLLYPCWLPGLFLANDFTVPGLTTNRGDGKNPAPLRIIRPPPYPKHPRFPAAVLLRSAIQKRDTAKPLP
jgi:hypothetical protein